ncbi:hypothetical protein [Herpetosiphon geysericola]|uniref:CopG family transcriptional regulator n=1 Tax=Herpetosiphon geysericola TaxID=70996 RepID=A0A0P6YDW1_9CHLR|nr:hypothetical protein [Herpetosiphon geysericola]KPL80213.1 hypothetical protein SE18_24465 [Herpetosiphon geysericola]
MAKIYTPDGESTDLGEVIAAWRMRQRLAEEAEQRAAFIASQNDPEVRAWIEIAQNEEALRAVARHVRPTKKPAA